MSFRTAPNSVQAAFLRRAMSTLERIAATIPSKALTTAPGAPTGAGTLVEIPSHPEFIGEAVADLDSLARRSRAISGTGAFCSYVRVVLFPPKTPVRLRASPGRRLTSGVVPKRSPLEALRQGSDHAVERLC
ncbi:hypothetical protein ACWGNA_13065 [Brucella cytisi]|uniref:hypothetical protein n=1 Tax=Brucella cytisi TaxID=407152 RepID=UPI0035DB3A2B